MMFLEKINSVLSGVALPVMLLGCGIYFSFSLRMFFIAHPIKFIKDLKCAAANGGTSPFKAMSLALAGTLGVGNISGVATAITAGGAGAIFWMWASALLAMSVKYAEVVLAIRYRQFDDGKYHGGAMYYIRDGFKKSKWGWGAGAVFAALCLLNSQMTGNVVQINAAADAAKPIPPIAVGIVLASLTCIIAFGGAKRISSFTVALIPVLSVAYIAISSYIIFTNADLMPKVFSEILKSAFNFRAAAGGVAGFAVNAAIRFGVTRGIFSNEAGCGTAPTAHASANVRSPHHQGCFGIFEVFADTILLCSMTAFVILIAKLRGYCGGLDGISLSVEAYSSLAGGWAGHVIAISVILFAFATLICQSYYGLEALGYFTQSPSAKRAMLICSAVITVLGSVISAELTWQIADLTVALMTIINCAVLVAQRKTVLRLRQ